MRAPICLALPLAAALAVVGCRDEGESCDEEVHAEVAGSWAIELTVTRDSCDPEEQGEVQNELATIEQDGRAITIDLGSTSPVLHGHVCGQSFSVDGSETEELLGCVWTETVSARGTVTGDSMSGSVSWAVRVPSSADCLGAESCTGAYDVAGSRL